jgi:hypothetical protein
VGRRAGLMVCMHTRWRDQLGPGALGTVRGQRNGVRTARPGRRQCARAGMRSRGHGPGHDDRRVVHATTAYGRRAVWAPARRRRRVVKRRTRSGIPSRFQFVVPLFDRFKLKNFELKFKFAKYKIC